MVIDSVKVKRLNGSRRPRPTTRSRDFLRLNKSWMNSINQKAAPWKESCKLLRNLQKVLAPSVSAQSEGHTFEAGSKVQDVPHVLSPGTRSKMTSKNWTKFNQKMISKCMWAVDDSLRSSKSEEAEGPNWVQLRRLRSQPAHELHLSESRWPID